MNFNDFLQVKLHINSLLIQCKVNYYRIYIEFTLNLY